MKVKFLLRGSLWFLKAGCPSQDGKKKDLLKNLEREKNAKNVATAVHSTPHFTHSQGHTHTHTHTHGAKKGRVCVASEGPSDIRRDNDLETSPIRENKAEKPTNQPEEEEDREGEGGRKERG